MNNMNIGDEVYFWELTDRTYRLREGRIVAHDDKGLAIETSGFFGTKIHFADGGYRRKFDALAALADKQQKHFVKVGVEYKYAVEA